MKELAKSWAFLEKYVVSLGTEELIHVSSFLLRISDWAHSTLEISSIFTNHKFNSSFNIYTDVRVCVNIYLYF